MKLPELKIVESVVISARLQRCVLIHDEEVPINHLIEHLEQMKTIHPNTAPFVRDYGMSRFDATLSRKIVQHLVALSVLSISDQFGHYCAPQMMCGDHRIFPGPGFTAFLEQLQVATDGNPGEKALAGRKMRLEDYLTAVT